MHTQIFTSLGISHRVSCPHTHQQNGSAERKHRHIVETGLALLAHASMPLRFWDEAFLTAAYLVNRLPTRVIDNLSPLERPFNVPPNYSMLKIFGCACWPHLRPYNKHKLEFRSKPCVFLGYSSLHKGYKCLDLDSSRVYISRDVVFDEIVFPFSKTSPNLDQQLGDNNFELNNNRMLALFPANPVHADTFAADPPGSGAQSIPGSRAPSPAAASTLCPPNAVPTMPPQHITDEPAAASSHVPVNSCDARGSVLLPVPSSGTVRVDHELAAPDIPSP